MNNLRFSLVVLALAAAVGAAAQKSDDSFNIAIQKINESAAKTAAAQAKRAEAAKAAKAAGKAPACTQAQADLARCEASIKKEFGSVRDSQGVLNKGFTRETSLVLLTATDAFFYHEDCDICAAVERCSLKDGKISNFKSAHSVDCGDLAPFLKKDVVYSSCPLKP